MTTNNTHHIPDDPLDAAAHWFTREHGGLMTPAEREAFEQWRQADTKHEQAYQEMLKVWGVAQATPELVFTKILNTTAAPASRPPNAARRHLILGLGAACSAAVAGIAFAPEHWLNSPQFTARYTSQRGERQRIDLPDGSTLTLNTDSIALVQFYRSERRVVLEQGEAFFAIQSAPERPFMVDAGLATIKVTGTQFNVRRDPEQVRVAVVSGSIELAQGPWWHRAVHRLGASHTAHITDKTQLADVSAAKLESLTAWRQGKIVFDSTPLGHILSEINRYRQHPIALQDTALRQLRITGVFSTDEPDAFLDVLPLLAPVTVLRLADGRHAITPR